MKRLHVHVAVDDLGRSIGFYSTLFAAEPVFGKVECAKWMLDDPKVNFANSAPGAVRPGLDHLSIQVETDDEPRDLADRLKAPGKKTRDQEATTFCYARSNESWADDPSGVRWESLLTFGEAMICGDGEASISAEKKVCVDAARGGHTAGRS